MLSIGENAYLIKMFQEKCMAECADPVKKAYHERIVTLSIYNRYGTITSLTKRRNR